MHRVAQQPYSLEFPVCWFLCVRLIASSSQHALCPSVQKRQKIFLHETKLQDNSSPLKTQLLVEAQGQRTAAATSRTAMWPAHGQPVMTTRLGE